MTQEQRRMNDADAYQSDHEREVAEHVESAGGGGPQRPTSGEDLAADRTPGDASDEAETPAHPSPADGGTTEPAERAPRPSQAEGER